MRSNPKNHPFQNHRIAASILWICNDEDKTKYVSNPADMLKMAASAQHASSPTMKIGESLESEGVSGFLP